ncbi:NAD(+) diphosphatase [Nocardioides sp. Kera G14]|uniref:NAD(+) diphosphatase n=1 Tax=Nocardioides sp. Kera G14 TaxID=2884264 RepID=UPI001D110DFC|nr:NAD(+) diphosphatase [Nocardioides sp. Kera G14]UDY24572.1 NAD(+) diphosphatase [Nocardioides sp. Kera G14]
MTLPHERLHEGAHDRLGHLRGNDDWEAERWLDPSTRVLVVAGTRISSPLTWLSPAEAPEGRRVLLGERDGRAYFAVIVSRDHADDSWLPLRSVLPELVGATDALAPLVFHAIGMAEWLAATRFCPRCGGPLVMQSSGHELACSDGHVQFPRSDPAVIMLITHGEPGSSDEVALLGRKGEWPDGRFSTLAGFCEPGESLEDAVRREVAEEAGVRVGAVQYVGNQPWPLPASLMLGFTGVALDLDINTDAEELDEARWFTREDLLRGAKAGDLLLPGEVSISRSLIEGWVGQPLPGSW